MSELLKNEEVVSIYSELKEREATNNETFISTKNEIDESFGITAQRDTISLSGDNGRTAGFLRGRDLDTYKSSNPQSKRDGYKPKGILLRVHTERSKLQGPSRSRKSGTKSGNATPIDMVEFPSMSQAMLGETLLQNNRAKYPYREPLREDEQRRFLRSQSAQCEYSEPNRAIQFTKLGMNRYNSVDEGSGALPSIWERNTDSGAKSALDRYLVGRDMNRIGEDPEYYYGSTATLSQRNENKDYGVFGKYNNRESHGIIRLERAKSLASGTTTRRKSQRVGPEPANKNMASPMGFPGGIISSEAIEYAKLLPEFKKNRDFGSKQESEKRIGDRVGFSADYANDYTSAAGKERNTFVLDPNPRIPDTKDSREKFDFGFYPNELGEKEGLNMSLTGSNRGEHPKRWMANNESNFEKAREGINVKGGYVTQNVLDMDKSKDRSTENEFRSLGFKLEDLMQMVGELKNDKEGYSSRALSSYEGDFKINRDQEYIIQKINSEFQESIQLVKKLEADMKEGLQERERWSKEQDEWRIEREEWEKQIKREEERKELKLERERKMLNLSKSEVETLKKEKMELEKKVCSIEADHRLLMESLEDITERNGELREEVVKCREEMMQLEKELTEKHQSEINDLKVLHAEKINELEAENGELKVQLEKNKENSYGMNSVDVSETLSEDEMNLRSLQAENVFLSKQINTLYVKNSSMVTKAVELILRRFDELSNDGGDDASRNLLRRIINSSDLDKGGDPVLRNVFADPEYKDTKTKLLKYWNEIEKINKELGEYGNGNQNQNENENENEAENDYWRGVDDLGYVSSTNSQIVPENPNRRSHSLRKYRNIGVEYEQESREQVIEYAKKTEKMIEETERLKASQTTITSMMKRVLYQLAVFKTSIGWINARSIKVSNRGFGEEPIDLHGENEFQTLSEDEKMLKAMLGQDVEVDLSDFENIASSPLEMEKARVNLISHGQRQDTIENQTDLFDQISNAIYICYNEYKQSKDMLIKAYSDRALLVKRLGRQEHKKLPSWKLGQQIEDNNSLYGPNQSMMPLPLDKPHHDARKALSIKTTPEDLYSNDGDYYRKPKTAFNQQERQGRVRTMTEGRHISSAGFRSSCIPDGYSYSKESQTSSRSIGGVSDFGFAMRNNTSVGTSNSNNNSNNGSASFNNIELVEDMEHELFRVNEMYIRLEKHSKSMEGLLMSMRKMLDDAHLDLGRLRVENEALVRASIQRLNNAMYTNKESSNELSQVDNKNTDTQQAIKETGENLENVHEEDMTLTGGLGMLSVLNLARDARGVNEDFFESVSQLCDHLAMVLAQKNQIYEQSIENEECILQLVNQNNSRIETATSMTSQVVDVLGGLIVKMANSFVNIVRQGVDRRELGLLLTGEKGEGFDADADADADDGSWDQSGTIVKIRELEKGVEWIHQRGQRVGLVIQEMRKSLHEHSHQDEIVELEFERVVGLVKELEAEINEVVDLFTGARLVDKNHQTKTKVKARAHKQNRAEKSRKRKRKRGVKSVYKHKVLSKQRICKQEDYVDDEIVDSSVQSEIEDVQQLDDEEKVVVTNKNDLEEQMQSMKKVYTTNIKEATEKYNELKRDYEDMVPKQAGDSDVQK
ncbi:hypothetical protein AX774_g541 [Zancudomyces culisetae]|uniref:Uncharacterized protein n=1 Tax=Zancudomyces culisetae TaxID=1213189 RepID=A0A1R1PY60_ZANCU|nr:hypothetical protein AX774_g541 [Zancudomyces culisetae]|eukprot:OMH85896.1 hypothetical protein AX774_g541 [Zancudomyces culisetae]